MRCAGSRTAGRGSGSDARRTATSGSATPTALWRDVPHDELVDRIAAILDEERPDVVVTFGPDGITGHPDHITIGRATTDAFLRLAGGPDPGLRRLTHGAIRQSVIDQVEPAVGSRTGWSRSTRRSSTTCVASPTS